MKRLVAALLMVITLLVCGATPALADSGGLLIDGKNVQLTVAPTVVGGVLMVPVRDVVQGLGDQVTWEASTHKVVLQTLGRRVELTPGQATAVIEDEQIELAAPVTMQSGHMLVPAGFLLTLYGDRLRLTQPELMAPAALALLQQVQLPANFDFQLTLKMHTQMTGMLPAMPDLPAGGASPDWPTTMEMGASADGFVRGHDALISLRDPTISPATGKANTLRIAVRDGHAYMRMEDTWEEMPGQPAAALPLDVSQLLPMLQSVVREAHLGGARVVDGHQLQDVVVMLDPSALVGSPAVAGPLYQSLGCTVTLDVATHEVRGFALAMVLMTKDQIEGHDVGMHMAVHLAGTIVADAMPIAWPGDLR